ncbi:hypothetical protein LPJ66_004928 [Kickxella alabastrina]|uniref:Uncharacterized protein n=1 Tax=Kickxella alabastrina TaxID=61397 RepID=A0ACC1IGM4_9FUNG|nr:hypothetical protein LPJ66_004928 [Kickxella alabastrina]
MEIQIVDEPPTATATAAANFNSPALRLKRKLTVKYRTLSIQMGMHNQSRYQRPTASQSFFAKLQTWLYCKLHIHGAHSQHQTDYNDQQNRLNSNADELSSLKFHLDTVNQTLAKFGTSPIQGLEDPAVKRRRKRDSPNTLSSPPNRILLKLFEWLFSGFCPLLWIAAIFVWISWKPLGKPPNPQYLALGISLIVVIALQASFSAWQEWTTSRVMASITSMLPTKTIVIRNGELVKIVAGELVQGDIVHVRGGDKVPADLRLIEVTCDLRFGRSMLTGESDASVATVSYTDENYLETRNIAIMGTHVTQGSGIGIVVATSNSTVMGRIARMTASKKPEQTLLQIELTRFVTIVAILSLLVGVTLIIIWAVWLQKSFPTFLLISDALVNSAGVIVAFVPDGLPICLTLTLTLIAKRMQRQNVLVKNLTMVETLGSVNIICSDKTGTLTCNRMSVVNAGFLDAIFTPDALRQQRVSSKGFTAAQRLYKTAALCNSASFDPATSGLPIDKHSIIGDATDSSILRFAEHTCPVSQLCGEYCKLFKVPFNSKNKWMLSLQQNVVASNSVSLLQPPPLLLVKGAPDVLLPRCSTVQDASGQIHPLNTENIERLRGLQRQWSGLGQRVLLLCRREFSDINPFAGLEDNQAELERVIFIHNCNLCVVGLVSIEDPPRKEIPHVVDMCRRAGIRVFMVTGDFALTATAIARQCHIITNDRVDTIEDVHGGLLKCAQNTFVSAANNMLQLDEDSSSIVSAVTHHEDNVCSLVLSGSEFNSLQNEHWDIICAYGEIVFACTTPEQKLRIVQELRRRGFYIAVTGDGVNDSPALKAAHIGVAMGGGSEVAKEAADMVLLDNNFASIIVAIENGRLVFENLKVLIYLMPAGSFSEFIPMLFNMVLGVPLPLSVIFMVVICMLTDVWASISLMYESSESDIMLRAPRNPKREHLVDLKFFGQAYCFIGLLEALSAHIIFFVFMYWHGGFTPGDLFLAFDKWTLGDFHGKDQATLNLLLRTGQSIHFLTLVILQWGNMFATRTRRLSVFQQNPLWGPTRNLRLLAAIPFTLGVVFLFCYVGWFNRIFGTAHIPLPFFFIPIPFALFILCMDELRKLVVRTRPSSIVARAAW